MVFTKIFEKPIFQMVLFAGLVIYPYIEIIRLKYASKCGYEEGYEKARKEIMKQAKDNVAATMSYIEEDNKKISNGESIPDGYLKGKVAIHLLPRWSIKLLGDEYIIRRPLKEHHSYAWLMTAEDSKKMDLSIQETLGPTKFAIDEVSIGTYQNNMKKEIQNMIEDYCDKVVVKK